MTPSAQSRKSGDDTVATFQDSNGGQPIAYHGSIYIANDKTCTQLEARQFPIWGYVRVGQEFRPATSTDTPEPALLIDGLLRVAAHAIYTRALYEVTTVTIPVGARLETYVPSHDPAGIEPNQDALKTDQSDRAIWWGTAYVDPQRTALVVAAATEAPRLALYRPNQTGADVIEASTLSQLTEDPTIVRFHIVLLVLGIVATGCEKIAEHWQDHVKRKGGDLR